MPSNPVTWNRYSYVAGDPINYSDPSGLDLMYSTMDGKRDCTYFLTTASIESENPETYAFWQSCVDTSSSWTFGPSGTPVPSAQNWDLLREIQAKLDAALSHSDCSGIFGKAPGLLFGTSSTPTAAQVLDSLISGGSKYGSIQFATPGDGSGTILML